MNASRPRNSKYYKLGLFYYNANDPSLFVDRKVGIGQDLNWAHKKSYWLFIFLLLFPVLPTIIALYFLGYL